MAGLLDSFKESGAGILNELGEEFTKDKVMAFLASPEATALAAGLSDAPSFSAGLGAGMKNISEIEKERIKHPASAGGFQEKFGKALLDYNAIEKVYGPDHQYTKLAKQNLERLAQGSPGITFSTNPDGTFTAQIGGSGGGISSASPVNTGGAVKTPPSGATITDAQKQQVAEAKMEILRPFLNPNLVGAGSTQELATLTWKVRNDPNSISEDERERLIELATAEKLVSFGANLNLIAEGAGVGKEATNKQIRALTLGWPDGVYGLLDKLPKDILREATERAEAVKSRLKKAGDKELITGFAIDVKDVMGDKGVKSNGATPKKFPKIFPTAEAGSYYLKTLGISEQKMAEVAKKRGISIQELADQVYAEKKK